jgi:hypothetical protein
MTDQIIRVNETEEDEANLTTPVAPHQLILLHDNLDRHDDDAQTIDSSPVTSISSSNNAMDYEENDAIESTAETTRVIMLPIPGSSSPESQPAASLAEDHLPRISVSLDNLPDEAASAGISIGGMFL